MRGRWRHQRCQNARKIYPQLALACEGDGGGVKSVQNENSKDLRMMSKRHESTSGSLLHVREVEVQRASKGDKNHC
jgi:hypothetical protein